MTPNTWRIWRLLEKPADPHSNTWPQQQAWGRNVWRMGNGLIAALLLGAFLLRWQLQTPLNTWLVPQTGPAPTLGLLFFSLALCSLLLVALLRLVRLASTREESSLAGLAFPGAAILVLLLLLAEGQIDRLPLLLGLGSVLLSEGAFWGYLLGNKQQSVPATQTLPIVEVAPATVRDESRNSWALAEETVENADSESGDETADEMAEELPAEDLLQRWTRHRDLNQQTETLSGILRADFPAGDPLCVLHVSFCPPFASAPELHCEVSGELSPDAPDATIRVTLCETFGARLEVRLQKPPQQPLTLFIEFFGTASTSPHSPS